MNGEIYNHEELRKRLPNHKFRTGSDCDVIAHLVCHLPTWLKTKKEEENFVSIRIKHDDYIFWMSYKSI